MSDDAPPTTLPPRTRDLARRGNGQTHPRPVSRTTPAPAPRPSAGRSQAPLYTAGALALSVLALCACLVGVFKVQTIQVVGAGLPAAAMADAAAVSGQNVFTVRSDLVIDRMASLPAVEVTRVETDFPDRVVIYARLREPAIAWQSAHGTLLIDRYGHVLGPATRSTLPLVSGPQPPDSDTITAVKYALRLLPAAPDGAVAGFSLDRSTGLSIHGRSGWQAVLGSGTAQNLVIRIANLQVVLNTVARNGQRLATADMRHGGAFYHVRGS